jgi:GH24 family phage-related lysozyme (muramidase)
MMLEEDLAGATVALRSGLPWADALDGARRDVLINMVFNLGLAGLLEFTTFLALVREGKYGQAADDLATTKAAQQDVERYRELAEQMRSGVEG